MPYATPDVGWRHQPAKSDAYPGAVSADERGKGELITIAAVAIVVVVALQVVAWVVGTVLAIVKLVALLVIVGVAVTLALRSSDTSDGR